MTIEEFITRNQWYWKGSIPGNMCEYGGYSPHHAEVREALLEELNALKSAKQLKDDLETLFSNNNSWSQPE